MKRDNLILIAIPIAVLSVIGILGFMSTQEKDEQSDELVADSIGNEEIGFQYATYVDYNDKIHFENENNVIFFSASWCATCHEAKENFKNNLSKIPGNLTIYEADIDRFKDLKKKYGVTVQHTYVQVDKNGKELNQWIGSNTINEVLDELV
ncbi:MAG: thioredoxin family protein [Candidatus Dojkabacteria bacterium]|nr:thioredoxin family protein [Candidatus Dojkabacteria bacterium]MDQ7020748.1 thioredoxin family protein [Candidatus Dojkabacteria bacterium]